MYVCRPVRRKVSTFASTPASAGTLSALPPWDDPMVLKLSSVERHRLDALAKRGLPVVAWRGNRDLEALVLAVSSTPYVLGRASTAAISLADRTVSGSHALLEVASPEDVYVVDNGSLNGTYVNGVRIRRRARLKDGATLKLGVEWLLIRLANTGTGTAAVQPGRGLEALSPRRFEVLWWLCEPMTQRDRPEPASRSDLCAGLAMSPSTLGEHLRGAADALEVAPGEGMRLRLAQRAIRLGIAAWEKPSGPTR